MNTLDIKYAICKIRVIKRVDEFIRAFLINEGPENVH